MKARPLRRENFRSGEEVEWRSDSHVSFIQGNRWRLIRHLSARRLSSGPGKHLCVICKPKLLNMWTGLTSKMSPSRNTIATQETISAWFWMTNSWLSTGGFLLLFFRIPISAQSVPTWPLRCSAAGGFCRVWWISFRERNDQSVLRLATSKGPGSNWMACHSSASGRVHGRETLRLTNETLDAHHPNIWALHLHLQVWRRVYKNDVPNIFLRLTQIQIFFKVSLFYVIVFYLIICLELGNSHDILQWIKGSAKLFNCGA